MKRFASLSLVMLTCTAAICLLANAAAAAEKKAAVDPSGTWRWEHEEEGETVKNELKITYDGKKLTGTYQGKRGPVDIADGKIEQDQLTVNFAVDVNGTKVIVDLLGTVKEDIVDGTVTLKVNDESQDYPWTAERSLKETDVVGTWKLEVELPDGNVLTPQVKLSLTDDKKQLKAEYTSDNAELDVSDIKVNDNKLQFTIKGDFDGSSLTATYKVQPRGNKLEGEVEYDFNGQTGELTVKGKRDAEKKKD